MEAEYERKRSEMVKKYEAIKSAEEVSLDAIPLPNAPSTKVADDSSKKPSILKTSKIRNDKEPPGCPIGAPPNWSSYDIDEEEDDEEILEEDVDRPKKIKFEDEVNDHDNISEFLKEIEQISEDKEKVIEPKEAITKETNNEVKEAVSSLSLSSTSQVTPASTFYRTPIQPAPPIVPDMLRVPQRLHMPPPMFGGDAPPPTMRSAHQMNRPMFTPHPAPPYPNFAGFLHQHQQQYSQQPPKPEKPKTATIEAAPQLRNLSADTTKFMPLALRVRRDDKRDQPTKKGKRPGKFYNILFI